MPLENPGNPEKRPSEIILTKEQIQARITELGQEISRDFSGQRPVFVCLLNGGVMFFADLMRVLDQATLGPFEMDSMRVRSYPQQGHETTGRVEIISDLTRDVEGRTVVLVDDLIDTGGTLRDIQANLEQRGAAKVALCVLAVKDRPENEGLSADYVGFRIPNRWVFGYGPDDGGVTEGDGSRAWPDIKAFL